MPTGRRRNRFCYICLTVACRCRRRRRRRWYPGPPGFAGPCGNLVENGAFTEWTSDTQPEGWDIADNVEREELTSLVYTRPYAARLGADPSLTAFLGQTIVRAVPGFCYRFEFQMHTGIGQTAQVFFGDRPVVTLDITPTSGPGRFSYYSVYTPCLPPRTLMTILFTKSEPGILVVDDVAVSVAGACIPNRNGNNANNIR